MIFKWLIDLMLPVQFKWMFRLASSFSPLFTQMIMCVVDPEIPIWEQKKNCTKSLDVCKSIFANSLRLRRSDQIKKGELVEFFSVLCCGAQNGARLENQFLQLEAIDWLIDGNVSVTMRFPLNIGALLNAISAFESQRFKSGKYLHFKRLKSQNRAKLTVDNHNQINNFFFVAGAHSLKWNS